MAKNGTRQSKKPTVKAIAERVLVIDRKLNRLMGLFRQVSGIISAIQEKLTENADTTKAFHKLFIAKKIFKDKELQAEVQRVIKDREEEEEKARDKRAGLKDKGDDTVIEKGDIVIISYEGTLDEDDAPFEGGVADKFIIKVGDGDLVPGFEEQLIGHRVGQVGVVDIVFPDDYRKDLKNKKARFKVTIHRIKIPVNPEPEQKEE